MHFKKTAVFSFLLSLTAPVMAVSDISLLEKKVAVDAGKLGEQLIGERRPAGNGLPAHLRFTFDEDRLSENIVFRERQLLIIPVADYRATFQKKDRAIFDLQIKALRGIIYGHFGRDVRLIPVFPPPPGEQSFHARTMSMPFNGGAGVRFITRFGAEKTLSTNDNIFYTFQGLSRDGKTLVCFFHPIGVRNLPISEDASISGMFMDEQDPDRFTPNLDLLDQIVLSIQIKK